jgi:hypothetical protein
MCVGHGRSVKYISGAYSVPRKQYLVHPIYVNVLAVCTAVDADVAVSVERRGTKHCAVFDG